MKAKERKSKETCILSIEADTELVYMHKGFRLFNIDTKEQYYSTLREYIIIFLNKHKDWKNVSISEGRYPTSLF